MSIEETTVFKCTCERCGHKWITKTKEKPLVCPKCKSPYWDKPRKKEVKKETAKKSKEAKLFDIFI